MENQAKQKWDSLSSNQRRSFGDRFITHESNLSAWDKFFEDLSPLKKQRVEEGIMAINPNHLNYFM